MKSPLINRLASRVLDGDIAWFQHHLRLIMGMRNLIPRPTPLVSQIKPLRTSAPAHTLKILVFSHNLHREGASISLKELVMGLKDHSFLIEVIAFCDGPLRSEYEAYGIQVKILPSIIHRISTEKRLLNEVDVLSHWIKDSSANVVFVNTLLNFPAVLAAEKAGVPSVWNPRESESWDRYFRFLPDPVAQLAIAAIGLPKKVVFVAEATRNVWKDFETEANFTTIHNALNISRFSPFIAGNKNRERSTLGWSEDEIVFLCVGTLCERKGQIDALQALALINNQLNTPVRLIFVGNPSGRYAEELQRFALGFNGDASIHIDFKDSTTEIGRYYLAADVFMLCSRVESYPRVVLEALAFGLPIIATPVFGVVEQLPEPADACFYEPGDVATLSIRMLELASNRFERQRLSERSKIRFSKMERFEQMLLSYIQILQEVGMYSGQRLP